MNHITALEEVSSPKLKDVIFLQSYLLPRIPFKLLVIMIKSGCKVACKGKGGLLKNLAELFIHSLI